MTKMSDAQVPNLTLEEILSDGSTLSNPAADYRRLFLGEDGLLHLKDSAGSVTDVGGGGGDVATDAIWDAAGDLAVGSGADTAARLAIGSTNGMVVARVSGAVAWALPPGFEKAYAQITANVTTTSTSAADATGLSVSYTGDGSSVWVEAWTGELSTTGSAGGDTRAVMQLYDTTGAAMIAQAVNVSVTGNGSPVIVRAKVTEASGSQSYKVQFFTISAGTATIRAAATNPAYIRVTKA